MESDTSPVKPTVIDLDPDEVTGDTQRSTAEAPPTKPAKAAGSRLLPVAVAALVIGGVGGGWLYRDYVSSYFPSNEMTALQERVDVLGKSHELLGGQMQNIDRISSQLAADLDSMESKNTGLLTASKEQSDAMAAATQRIASLEAANVELKTLVETLRNQPVSTDGVPVTLPVDLVARIQALEKDVASLKTQEPGRADTTALTQALSDLKAKIESGVGFADEQQRIARMVPAAAGLDIMELHAATGLPAAKTLAGELAALKPSLPVPETAAPAAEAGYWNSMMAALSSIITIRDLEATNWQTIADKAIALADAGDLTQAIAVIDEVEGALPTALQQWRDRAASRLALEAALASVSESVGRDLAARP